MARVSEQQVHFDRPGLVRVAVRIEVPGVSSYVQNLRYADEQTAINELDADIAELLTLSDLCGELQTELARPQFNRVESVNGFRCQPFDRRATIQEKLLIPGAHFNDQSRIRLFLADELQDVEEPALNAHLHREERIVYRCSKGCEYAERTVAALPFYLAEHRKVVRDHAAQLAVKRELWRRFRPPGERPEIVSGS